VTQIVDYKDGRDPSKKVIGIVTLEDIIEDIIQDDIEDEFGFGSSGAQLERQQMKEKLVLLFTDHEAQSVLSEHEIKAILEFLQKYVKPFHARHMKRDLLNVLIRKSHVIELESDESPHSHKIDQLDELGRDVNNYSIMSDQQYFYNKIKNESMRENAKPHVSTLSKSVKIPNLPKVDEEIEEEEEFKPKYLHKEEDDIAALKDIKVENGHDMAINKSTMTKDDVETEGNDSGIPHMNTTKAKKTLVDEIKKTLKPHEDLLNNEIMDQMINPILYVRGCPNDSFYLILSGKVMICSGNEGFLLE
jgi:hypothetical protein